MILRRIFINTSDIQQMYGISPRKAQYLLEPVKEFVSRNCNKRRTQVTFMEFFEYYGIPMIFLKVASPELAKNIEEFLRLKDESFD